MRENETRYFTMIHLELQNAEKKHPNFVSAIIDPSSRVSWAESESRIKARNAMSKEYADNILMEEMAEAFNAYQKGDKANYNEYAYKLKSKELVDTCQFFEEELRHNKYKRCLAMAKMCEEAYNRECVLNPEEMTNKEFYKQQIEFWPRWSSKWLKIAEKFKEAK